MYKVYEVIPREYYAGYALVAAHSAAEANEHISVLKECDPTNKYDSWGWTFVTEDDVIENIFAEKKVHILVCNYAYLYVHNFQLVFLQ